MRCEILSEISTANDVERASRDVLINVGVTSIGQCLVQLADENLTLFVEHMHKILQDLEVERWSQHLPPTEPFRPFTSNNNAKFT